MGLIQVSLRPFRADPFIGRFPGLKPRAESRSPLRGIKPAQRALIFAPFTADPLPSGGYDAHDWWLAALKVRSERAAGKD